MLWNSKIERTQSTWNKLIQLNINDIYLESSSTAFTFPNVSAMLVGSQLEETTSSPRQLWVWAAHVMAECTVHAEGHKLTEFLFHVNSYLMECWQMITCNGSGCCWLQCMFTIKLNWNTFNQNMPWDQVLFFSNLHLPPYKFTIKRHELNIEIMQNPWAQLAFEISLEMYQTFLTQP